jgi:HEAT repeat protein
MRRILILIVLISLTGCGPAQPTMAGAKWAEALHNPDVKVRRQAAFTLGNIGPSHPAVLPALIGALKDTDAEVRCAAILALLKYGPGAREAVPVLTECRHKDRDAKVRAYAARALDALEHEP